MDTDTDPEADPAVRLRPYLRAPREQQLLYVAAGLGLADLVAAGPRSGADLARATGTHPPALRRALRAMAVLGLLTECADGRFGLTPTGACLRSDVPGSLRSAAILAGECFPAWGGLLHAVRTTRRRRLIWTPSARTARCCCRGDYRKRPIWEPPRVRRVVSPEEG